MAKYCSNCGAEVNGKFCENCGTPVEQNNDLIRNEVGNNNTLKYNPKPHKKKKNGCLIALLVFMGFCVFVTVIALNSGINTDTDTTTSNDEVTMGTTSKKFFSSKRFDKKGNFKLENKKGTNEAVDEIMSKAKKDCISKNEYNLKAQDTALKKIKKLRGKFFESNANMEQVMYYGRILELSPDSKLQDLGFKSLKSVKYVYRGKEKKDSDTVKNTLEKIEDLFEQIDGKSNSEQKEMEVKEDLELLSYDSVSDEYSRYVVGRVKNNTDKVYSYVQVEVNLYKGDSLVGSTLDNVNNLEPGKVWEFKAPILEDESDKFRIVNVTGY